MSETYFERQRKLRVNYPYIETYFKDGKSWKTHANIPDFDKETYAKMLLSYDDVIKIVIDGMVFSKSSPRA